MRVPPIASGTSTAHTSNLWVIHRFRLGRLRPSLPLLPVTRLYWSKPGVGIMTTTWQTITVRVQRSEDSLGDFFAIIQSWSDHHCIVLVDFTEVALPNKRGVFDVVFDNPRDALLFERRFAGQPTSNIPLRIAPPRSINATASSGGDESRASILAVVGEALRGLWTPKFYEKA
jgi:hypothetical protein